MIRIGGLDERSDIFRSIPVRYAMQLFAANYKQPYMHETTWRLTFRGSGTCAAALESHAFQSNGLNMRTNSIESGKSKATTGPIGLFDSTLSQLLSLSLHTTAMLLASLPHRNYSNLRFSRKSKCNSVSRS